MATVINVEKAYKLGLKAAQEGKPLSDNPWKEFPTTSGAWANGWKVGNEQKVRQLHPLRTKPEDMVDLHIMYTLGEDGRTPTPATDTIAWADWMGDETKRRIGLDIDPVKQVAVSTLFLGINPGVFNIFGKPMLFQTMIFGGPHEGDAKNYYSWEDAEEGHKWACEVAGIKIEGEKKDV